jgi:transcription antitermination factor NusG
MAKLHIMDGHLQAWQGRDRGVKELATNTAAAGFPEIVRWFAVYTNSHHEKSVARQLAQRDLETFLPLYETLRRWRNRCQVKVERPLFANYVFVHIDPRQRVRVLEVPGVIALVGFGRNLAPLPDLEIEALRSGLDRTRIEPHPYVAIGERVRIRTGVMIGLEGVLVRNGNNSRVVLTLEAIKMSVAVEIDSFNLEPAGKSLRRRVQ